MATVKFRRGYVDGKSRGIIVKFITILPARGYSLGEYRDQYEPEYWNDDSVDRIPSNLLEGFYKTNIIGTRELDTNLKVTETPTEASFEDIFAGDNVINIPLFQREYKWTDKNLRQFIADIDAIVDGQKRSQFLGVIVTVPQPKPMGVPPINDVVDGQQRLFTCYISLLAAVKVALDLNEVEWAINCARSYLLLRQHSNFPTNTKIVPAAKDRQ